MSIIKFLAKQKPTNGFYLKELTIAGLKHDQPQTHLILEIMQIIKKHENDNETYSVGHCLDICKQLMYGAPITPIDNPTQTGEYIAHTNSQWQSTRLGSLFIDINNGLWYDINVVTLKMKIARFLYKYTKLKFLKPHLLFYVRKFPYTPPYDKFLNS
jgi:hypothetical protein